MPHHLVQWLEERKRPLHVHWSDLVGLLIHVRDELKHLREDGACGLSTPKWNSSYLEEERLPRKGTL
jgi:hypothetical protein